MSSAEREPAVGDELNRAGVVGQSLEDFCPFPNWRGWRLQEGGKGCSHPGQVMDKGSWM